MNVLIQRRAEIALRSLDPQEQKKVQAALGVLETTNLGEVPSSHRLRVLKFTSPEKLYTFRVNNELRLILSASESRWIVEDIMAHDRFARLFHTGDRS